MNLFQVPSSEFRALCHSSILTFQLEDVYKGVRPTKSTVKETVFYPQKYVIDSLINQPTDKPIKLGCQRMIIFHPLVFWTHRRPHKWKIAFSTSSSTTVDSFGSDFVVSTSKNVCTSTSFV